MCLKLFAAHSTAEGDAFYYAAYGTTLAYIAAAEWLARRPAGAAWWVRAEETGAAGSEVDGI